MNQYYDNMHYLFTFIIAIRFYIKQELKELRKRIYKAIFCDATGQLYLWTLFMLYSSKNDYEIKMIENLFIYLIDLNVIKQNGP